MSSSTLGSSEDVLLKMLAMASKETNVKDTYEIVQKKKEISVRNTLHLLDSFT